MAKSKYASQLEQRGKDRMRIWLDEGVEFCSENDIPERIQDKLRGQRVFHEYLRDLIYVLNKRHGKQIKWCKIDGVIYIDKPSIKKIINFLGEHEYISVLDCTWWMMIMNEFFNKGDSYEHTD